MKELALPMSIIQTLNNSNKTRECSRRAQQHVNFLASLALIVQVRKIQPKPQWIPMEANSIHSIKCALIANFSRYSSNNRMLSQQWYSLPSAAQTKVSSKARENSNKTRHDLIIAVNACLLLQLVHNDPISRFHPYSSYSHIECLAAKPSVEQVQARRQPMADKAKVRIKEILYLQDSNISRINELSRA